MKFLKALCALALLSATTGIMALKVAAGSPIAICTNKGFKQGTSEFDRCVRFQQIAQSGIAPTMMTKPAYRPISSSAYPAQYGPHTGIVPPQMRGQ